MIREGADRLRIDWQGALADRIHSRRRLLLATAAAAITLAFALAGTYVPASIQPGVGRLVPLLFALPAVPIAALAVLDPFSGLVAWVFLMPLLNVSRAQLNIGPLQLILSSLLLLALGTGVLIERFGGSAGTSRGRAGPWERVDRLSGLAAICLVALTIATTFASPGLSRSLPIGLHGVAEPVILAWLLIALRPSRHQLALLALAMGTSLGLATVINLARTLPAAHTLAALQQQRVFLARLTYFNVGIFGELLVTALPLQLGALMARKRLGLPAAATGLLVAGLAICIVALVLTYSKSAWLGGLGTVVLFVLLALRSWRSRFAVIAVLILGSAVFIPYPLIIGQLIGRGGAAAGGGLTVSLQGFERAASWDLSTAEGETSVKERFLATEGAIRMTIDHPVLGVGPGRFAAEYAAGYQPSGATRNLDSAHDFIANLAAEFGLPAAMLVLAAFAAAFLGAVRAVRRQDTRILGASVLAAIVGFMVTATLFGVDLYRPYRTMDSDVLFAALLVSIGVLLGTIPGATTSNAATTAQTKLG